MSRAKDTLSIVLRCNALQTLHIHCIMPVRCKENPCSQIRSRESIFLWEPWHRACVSLGNWNNSCSQAWHNWTDSLRVSTLLVAPSCYSTLPAPAYHLLRQREFSITIPLVHGVTQRNWFNSCTIFRALTGSQKASQVQHKWNPINNPPQLSCGALIGNLVPDCYIYFFTYATWLKMWFTIGRVLFFIFPC